MLSYSNRFAFTYVWLRRGGARTTRVIEFTIAGPLSKGMISFILSDGR